MSYGWRDCRKTLARESWLTRSISCLAVALDVFVRKRDFKTHRSWGGLLSRWRLFGQADGHAALSFFLPALLAVFVVFGPKPLLSAQRVPWQFALGMALLLAAWGSLVLIFRSYREHRLFRAQIIWLGALCGLVWIVVWFLESRGLSVGASPAGEATATEATDVLYKHLLLKLIPFALLPVVVLARLLSCWLTSEVRDRGSLPKRLSRAQLFRRPLYPRVTWGSVTMSLISAVLYRFVLLLWLPSLFLVVAIPTTHKVPYALVIGSFWLFAVLMVELHPRLDAMSMILRRSFFVGGQLLVSLLVIVLGLGRLAGIQYISSVVESATGGVLALFILAAYTFFWFYEYWVNRSLTERLLELLRGLNDPIRHVGQVTYEYKPRPSRLPQVLQVHGGARFVAIRGPKLPGPVFQLYERLDLFQRICRGAPDLFADIRKRVRFYFSVTNLALIGMVWFLGAQLFAGPQLAQHPQKPDREANDIADEQSADLRKLVFEAGANTEVLLLAASGGGTRAAMYTTAVLRGLAELGALDRLKLASGVSGGGAALAYYAGHRDELRRSLKEPAGVRAWETFQGKMDDPFIADVIEGAGEGRIFGATRLGQLLAESFARRFDNQHETFGEIGPDFGLILNTAVAGLLRVPSCEQEMAMGSPPRDEAKWLGACKDKPFRQRAHDFRERTRGSKKGARLIFTNLGPKEAFPGLQSNTPDYDRHRIDRGINISYEVVRHRSTELTTAAALNANFPPVFSNAAVDLEEDLRRYWVTDGGAVENRGVLSLLFALRDAAVRQPVMPDNGEAPPGLPRIHVIVVEASAAGSGYSRFPGLSSAFGAPSKIGTQLMKELVEVIRGELSRICGGCNVENPQLLDVHYLGMPGPLRVDGGLGTHWMLHEEVRLGDPHECDPDRRHGEVVAGQAVRDVIYQLFVERSAEHALDCDDEHPAKSKKPETDFERVWCAVESAKGASGCWLDDWHAEWGSLVEELRQGLPPPTAPPAEPEGEAAR